MDNLFIPEILIISSLKYISFPASSNPLSSPLTSELPDMMPQIEEDIKENKNEKKTDGEGKANNEIKNSNICRRKITKTHSRI